MTHTIKNARIGRWALPPVRCPVFRAPRGQSVRRSPSRQTGRTLCSAQICCNRRHGQP